MDRQQKRQLLFTGLNMVAVAIMFYGANRYFANIAPKQVSYSEFLTALRADNLANVQITERELIGTLKADASKSKSSQELTITATRLPGG